MEESEIRKEMQKVPLVEARDKAQPFLLDDHLRGNLKRGNIGDQGFNSAKFFLILIVNVLAQSRSSP